MRTILVFAVVMLVPTWTIAHDDHDALPTKGANVRGDRLLLSPAASRAIGLETAKIELAEVRRTVHAVGAVELPWKQQADVGTLVAGRVDRVLVKPGESIAVGQELAHIASAELERLQLTMLQASTAKSLSARLLEDQLAAGEGIAGKVLWKTRSEVQQQTTRFNIAWQQLRALGVSSEALQRVSTTGETVSAIALVSPMGGVVSAADARPGQIVRPDAPLYHIVDPSRLWFVGNVLEADAGRVKAGLPVDIRLAMLPGKSFRSEIDHVELRLNGDRTLGVKAVLDNPAGNLKPGMFGDIEIELAAEKAVVCPKEALIHDGASAYALVEQTAGSYVRKAVVVAAVRGQTAEIDEGLFPGDMVVTTGSQELAALFAKRTKARAPATHRSPAGTVALGQVELPIDQKTFASAPVAGRIRRILVEHGQAVRKGEVLAELESLPFKALQLEFLQARTNLKLAGKNRDRAESLSDAIARNDLRQLQAQYDTYQKTVASLRRQLALVGLSESEIAAIEQTDLVGAPAELSSVVPIRAPADGLICEFELIPGQFVAQQDPLFELHDLTKVWIRAFVFEQDAPCVRVGQAVQVRLASDPTFRRAGKVDRLDPVLYSGNRALSIWTELDNPLLQLKEGMAAVVTIVTNSSGPVAEN